MESLGIGKIIKDEQHRDAVHMAIAPVVASVRLIAGQDVFLLPDGQAAKGKVHGEYNIGIVDPFLKTTVKAGERFWIFLYPGSITSLRHEWTHPAFEVEPITEAHQELAQKVAARLEGVSLRWLKDYADQLNVTFDDLMSHTENYLENGSYWCDGGKFEGESLPDGFWDHYEKVIGKKVEEDKRDSFFTCSC